MLAGTEELASRVMELTILVEFYMLIVTIYLINGKIEHFLT